MGTVIVGILLVIVVTVVIGKMGKDRKRGKSSCGCDCSKCKGCL